jgi:hypothetical protein
LTEISVPLYAIIQDFDIIKNIYVLKPLSPKHSSTGYGASFGGIAALLGMLNTCAAGVTVVNIDNGFGAGGNSRDTIQKDYYTG